MIQFDGEIRDLSQSGLGVVNGPDGCVYFVQGGWPGDAGTFEILSQKKRYGFAKFVTLEKLSPHRLENVPCKFHGTDDGTCGGCPWIPFAYEDQLKRKDIAVRYALDRSKVLSRTKELLPILPSKKSLGYRNRAQVKTDGQKLGFVSYQAKTLVDVTHCVALNEECSTRLNDLREKLPNSAWTPREEFLWNYIDINDSSEWNPQKATINQRLPFAQGNHAQNENMKLWVARMLQTLPGKQHTVELFCGSGNFTEVLAASSKMHSVVAIEMSEPAIAELKSKKLPKVRAFVSDLYIPQAVGRIKGYEDQITFLVLDPPREGFEAIDILIKGCPTLKHVMYISCSLNTFARDTEKLMALGFEAVQIQPVDMFPNTPHLEICAMFRRA